MNEKSKKQIWEELKAKELKGKNYDGHNYIGEAFEKGAYASLVEFKKKQFLINI